jgi:hypothetical protein
LSDAESYCKTQSYNGKTGKLYAPKTRFDLALFDHIEFVSSSYWVGVKRNPTTGKFVDSDGDLVPDDLFLVGASSGNFDCAIYRADYGRLYPASSCSSTFFFLCQLPASTPSGEFSNFPTCVEHAACNFC